MAARRGLSRWRILAMWKDGYTSYEIARKIGCCQRTVMYHIQRSRLRRVCAECGAALNINLEEVRPKRQRTERGEFAA